jgi:acetyltransferase
LPRRASRARGGAEEDRCHGKPLIVYKAGNSEASGKAALSHTGTLVGRTTAYHAAFRQAGAIMADNLGAVLELANLFARNGRPMRGRGVGIMATSGGAGVINADKAEMMGLALPEPAPQTKEPLHKVVPDFGAVVVPLTFAHDGATGARAPVLCKVTARTDCAVAAVWMTDWLEGPGSAMLDGDSSVTLFRSAERCFTAIRAWMDWHERREAQASAKPAARVAPAGAAEAARAVIASVCTGGKSLSEQDSKRILSAYGITVPQEVVAPSPAEAAQAAARIGFPVVLKIASPDIQHKTEVEGIRLDLRSAAEVEAVAEKFMTAARRHRPDARLDGLSVQAMAPSGTELVLRIQRDAQFGPLVMVGLGGALVEMLGGMATSLAPSTPDDARRMPESLRGHRLLTGFRNQPPADINAAVDTICRFSEMAADLSEFIEEADVNPAIVGRTGATAADALIVLS